MKEYKIETISFLSDEQLSRYINENVSEGWELAFQPELSTRSGTNAHTYNFGKVTFVREK